MTRTPPSSALALWIRRDARRRIRSLVVLAVLVAAAGGVVLAAIAGGRREGTAVDRARARISPADAVVLLNQPGFDWEQVRRLPEVAGVALFAVTAYATDGIDPNGELPSLLPASPEAMVDIDRPLVVEGRLADPSRPDEVVVSREVRDFGVRVGDRLTLRMLSAESMFRMRAGGEVPEIADGPTQDAVVVGVVHGSDIFGDGIQPTLAFLERYRPELVPANGYINAEIRLRGGAADMATLRADLDRIVGHPVEVSDLGEQVKRVRHATDVERTALYAAAAASAVASLVLIGQSLLRTTAAPAAELPVLQALGVTRRERRWALAAAPAAAVLIGALVAGPVAFALSSRFPIGVGRQVEPAPGLHADWLVLGVGVVAIAAAGLAASAFLADRQVRASLGGPSRARPSRAAAVVASSGLPVPVALGARLALERGTGRAAVPVRAALVGAVVGVVGIVGALTFRVGLDRAVSDRDLFGQRFDAIAEDVQPGVTGALAADGAVDMVEDVRVAPIAIDGVAIPVFGIDDVVGSFGLRPLAGRLPARDDEISLAPTEVDRLGVDVGDLVAVGPQPFMMRVVGVTFTPEFSHTPYDEGARMTTAGLRRFVPDGGLKFHKLAVRFRPGTDVEAAIGRLAPVTGGVLDRAGPTEDQRNLRGVRDVPFALGVFLALLAVAAVGHALAAAVRRRRHDLAVLRVLGLTRRQARASVAWQATTIAAVGLVIGVPVGIAAGRTVWRVVADSTPMLYVAPDDLGGALAVVLVAVALANALAAWPGRIAARTRPAEILRVE